MWKFLFLFLIAGQALAYVNCDCQVVVHHPITSSHNLPPIELRTYQLERYDSTSRKSQLRCRQTCEAEYRRDLSTAQLKSLLVLYGQELIDRGELGYNCTGLTTMKFPVRVKARLGHMPLGNVEDLLVVVNHEEICFR